MVVMATPDQAGEAETSPRNPHNKRVKTHQKNIWNERSMYIIYLLGDELL